MTDGLYTRGEVVFCLSVRDPEDDGLAVELSVNWLDSIGSASGEDLPSTTSAEWDPVLFIARWREVWDARARVLQRRDAEREQRRAAMLALRAAEILDRRLAGETEREVAAAVGVSQPTVNRQVRSLVDEILTELGGEALPGENRTSSVSACLHCGQRPRARWKRQVLTVAGRRVVREERQASSCRECLPVERHDELVTPRSMLVEASNTPEAEAA